MILRRSPSRPLSASIVYSLSKLPPIRPDGSAYTHDSTSPSSLSFFAGSPLQLALHRALLRMSNALAPLKGITQNLPAFIRQPLIAVIGKECYTSLVWWVVVPINAHVAAAAARPASAPGG